MDDDQLENSDLPEYRIACEARGILLGWQRDPPPAEGRLHLRALSGPHECLVYLETEGGGRRAWDVATGSTALAASIRVEIELDRPAVERQWLSDCIMWGWISLSLQLPYLQLVVYGGTASRFERRLHVRRDLGLLRPPDQADAYSIVAEPEPAIVVGRPGMPSRWQTQVPIAPAMIWR